MPDDPQQHQEPPPEGGAPDHPTDPPAGSPEAAEPPGDAETFDRPYVERLRRESAGYRERASRADDALDRLATATIASATAGVLADASDITYDPETMADDDGWPDADRITEAARELVARKPHLADRRPSGDAGQGPRTSPEPVDLAGLLRSRA